MGFWDSVWASVLAGVLTFVITVAFPRLSRHIWGRGGEKPTGEPSASVQNDNHAITISGPVTGDVIAQSVDQSTRVNNSWVDNSKTTVQNRPTSGDGTVMGSVFFMLLAFVFVASQFIWFSQYVLLAGSAMLGILLGLVVDLSLMERSLSSRFSWSGSIIVVESVCVFVGFIAVWRAVRVASNNGVGLLEMRAGLSDSTNSRGVLDSLMERATDFTDKYGWDGAIFAVHLMFGAVLVTMLVYFLLRDCVRWSCHLRIRKGSDLGEWGRRAARQFGEIGVGSGVAHLFGTFILVGMAYLFGSGQAYEWYIHLAMSPGI